MDTWTIILSLVLGFLGVYHYCFRPLSYFRKLGIPHPRPSPILGNMASLLLRKCTVGELIQRGYNVHPDALYIGMYEMNTPMIMLRDPELIKFVSVKNFDHFTDHRRLINEDSDQIFNKVLFGLRGDRWREVRAMLSPAFTSSRIKDMFKLMAECASSYGDFMARLPSEERDMNVKNALTRYTNDVIATCAFGISVNSMKEPKNDFYMYGMEVSNFGALTGLKMFLMKTFPKLSRFFGLQLLRPQIGEFFKNVVSTTIRAREERGIFRPDMIQLMMETRDKGSMELTIDDMTSQAFMFFIGGFETTSTIMSFAAYELAIESEVQSRLREEIDGMLEETGGEITYEAVNGLEYLDAVLNEAMRLFPVIAVLDRVCVKDFELPPALPGLKPYTVKKGDNIWMPAYALQRDPKYFENPDRFNPDRFLGEGKKMLNSGAYLPFGIGPRMCLGNRFALLEIKVLLVHLLARCELKPCAKTVMPIKLNKASLNMVPVGDYWMRIDPRIDTHFSIAKRMTSETTKT